MPEGQLDVGVIGTPEYGSQLLLDRLRQHPRVRIAADLTDWGEAISGTFQHDPSWVLDAALANIDRDRLAEQCQVLFLALPRGCALALVPDLLPLGCRIIDLSADYRLHDLDLYRTWYSQGQSPNPSVWLAEEDIRQTATYGLPELFRSAISTATLVACPGEFATASLLAIAPLLRQGFIDPDRIAIDAKAGLPALADRDRPKTADRLSGIWTESVGQHCQTPEIERVCSDLVGRGVAVQFTVHRVPIERGLLVTVYAPIRDPGLVNEDLLTIYKAFYKQSAWIELLPSGQFPYSQQVVDTNICSVGLTLDGRTNRLVVLATLDEKLKGSIGQAIQCLNIVAGWDETLGLPQ
ncbi:N-acetyl-gamma-glutamyl-phosphate reductase [Synechococcus sp. PCC 7336]|uniref:N-acetyl-gamma-glutamyl-phosphate reductase n=1 Tax=Synechococcus sp. PCC 7336 TaxID=195250 RepID=UPI00034CA657|nr:N-acetyl-gamma-glutamyl-phosphate reductase [Synechococcus sp. PCC 7336]